MSNQDWNGPQGHRPAGRGPRVGLIVGGTLVLVALIALAVFLATRAGTTADPSPTPALPATSAPATTAPSPVVSEPGTGSSPDAGAWPELSADVLPATVGEWTLDEALLFYGRGGDAIYPASAGSNHPVASFADFLDKPAFSGDRVVCGTDSDSAPTCYIQTGDLGVVLVSDPAALVSVDDLAAFADAFAAQVG